MKSAGSKLLSIFLMVTGILMVSQTCVSAEEISSGELAEIKSRLAVIEQQQKEILAKEDKILAELDRVRIWVHRK